MSGAGGLALARDPGTRVITMDFKDYYQALGVSKTASADELKKAFRRLARKHHPDVNAGDPSAERRFKEINEAYEVVGDSVKRRKYDELGSNWKAFERAKTTGKDPFTTGWPFSDGSGGGAQWNVRGTDAGSGFRTMSEEDARQVFGNDPFSDFFQTFFSGGSSAGSPRTSRRRGRDVEHELTLTLEQAYTGITQRLTLRTGGRPRSVDIRIPAGVGDDGRVRIVGEGEPGTGGGPTGDLFLRIKLATHSVYERKGCDLYMKADVPVTTAVLGGEIKLLAIDGKTVCLKIPMTTQQGQVFRIKGRGMLSLRKGVARGHLYATANVQVPDHLTLEEREHYEALAGLERAADDHRDRPPRKAQKDPVG